MSKGKQEELFISEELEEPEEPELKTLTANEMEFSIPEEAMMHLNQMNAATMAFADQLDQRADEPMMRIADDKYTFYDGETPIMEAEWHLISEFRIVEMNKVVDENGREQKLPTKIEYVWGWAIRPDDPHTKAVVEVTESLPAGMNPLTFPMVQFGDIGVLEVLNAYAMEVLGLDYIMSRYSDENKSYGVFGLYNMKWLVEPKPIASRQMRQIVVEVKRVARKMRSDAKKDKDKPTISKKESIAVAWRDPHILALVAKYRRDKRNAEQTQKEFTELFEKAQKDPNIMFEEDEVSEPEPTPESKFSAEMNKAMDAIEAALQQADAEEH